MIGIPLATVEPVTPLELCRRIPLSELWPGSAIPCFSTNERARCRLNPANVNPMSTLCAITESRDRRSLKVAVPGAGCSS